MAPRNLFLDDQHTSSRRYAVLEDDGTSAWLYLTEPDSRKPSADAWVYNRIASPPTTAIESYRGGPPPAAQGYVSDAALCHAPKKQRWSFVWSADGESVALLMNEAPVACIVAGKKRGYSRNLVKKGPWGHPWSEKMYAAILDAGNRPLQPITIFGFRCTKKDEKNLMQRVNGFLATLDRTTSKTKNPSMHRRFLPFVHKHYYWNLNKSLGTRFDIYPNEDLEGKRHYPDHPEYEWLMLFVKHVPGYASVKEERVRNHLRRLLKAIPFEHAILEERESQKNEPQQSEPRQASLAPISKPR